MEKLICVGGPRDGKRLDIPGSPAEFGVPTLIGNKHTQHLYYLEEIAFQGACVQCFWRSEELGLVEAIQRVFNSYLPSPEELCHGPETDCRVFELPK